MADDSLGPDDIVRHPFSTGFRGYDPTEVRDFLKRVSDELSAARDMTDVLRRRLAEAERQRAQAPEIDESMLTEALGEETARVLKSAREAAAEITAKAEQKAARLVAEAQESASRLRTEAQEEAERLRSEAEGVLAHRVEEAERAVAGMREAAETEAAAIETRAQEEAESELEAARTRGREMLTEAQALREKVLHDLGRRRRLAVAQVEQLRAGRDRLIEAYRVVRRTLDEVSEELVAAEVEARAAADAAGKRAMPESSIEELEAELAANRPLAPPRPPEPEPESESESEQAPAVQPEGIEAAEPAPAPEPPAEPEPSAPPEPEAPAAEAPATEEPPPPPEPELEERRSSSLRILRRARPSGPAEPTELPSVEAPDTDEGVRVIRTEPSRESLPDSEPAPVRVSEAAAVGGPVSPAPREAVLAAAPDLVVDAREPSEPIAPPPAGPRPDVDELFARIKASRAQAVAEAERVLAEPERPSDPAVETHAPPPAAAVPPIDPVADPDEAALQRRDEMLVPIESTLVRRLKRALQDDQNAALDQLRTIRRNPTVDAMLPPAEVQAQRFRDAALPFLRDAAAAGWTFASGSGGDTSSAIAVAEELALDLVLPLRERLERALQDAAGAEDGGDASAVERVNAGYREWKLQRIEVAVRHAVSVAFATAAFEATEDGATLRWVVDDDGGPCPDCDDDALAGPTVKGEAYPTGQPHPPAHVGCRCLLVRAPL